MSLSEDGAAVDTQPDLATTTPPSPPRPVFDIDAFLGDEDRATDDGRHGQSRWLRKLFRPSIWAGLVEIGLGLTINVLKSKAGASVMLLVVVSLILGPSAPWNQLAWNVLRGGTDDASAAQCNEIGDWFSLFDQQTDRVYSLMQEAGSPDTWDSATTTKLSMLLPMYMDDWLAEIKKHDPPPSGRQLNNLFASLLENYKAYVVAIEKGDAKLQQHYERENSLILRGIDIEVRYITNLCV